MSKKVQIVIKSKGKTKKYLLTLYFICNKNVNSKIVSFDLISKTYDQCKDFFAGNVKNRSGLGMMLLISPEKAMNCISAVHIF